LKNLKKNDSLVFSITARVSQTDEKLGNKENDEGNDDNENLRRNNNSGSSDEDGPYCKNPNIYLP
jgi:hypothetical protein